MRTLLTALAAYSGCAAARRYLDRPGRPERGLSNLQERLTEGRVYDYLHFPRAPRPLNRYVFNLADLCVFAGGALCLLRGGKGSPSS